MANGICALVNPVQLTTRKPPLDRASSHPQFHKLPPADDSVLPFRKLRNHPVDRTKPPFSIHDMGNGGFVGHAAMLRDRSALVVR